MRSRLVAFSLLLLCACPDLGGGGGGGGGGGTINFTEGFAFIRRDDRNVYLADKSDFSQVMKLTSSGDAHAPALSRDGKRVVYVSGSGSSSTLSVIATTGTGSPGVLLSNTAQTPVANVRTPVFSPDGSKVAFAFDSGGASAVGIVGADGSGFVKLAGNTSLSYASPSWYPDGKSVLAVAGTIGNYTQLEKLDASTGAPTNISNALPAEIAAYANRAVLSPDGSKVAFDGRLSSGPVRIFAMTLSTQAVTQLTDYPGDLASNDSFPSWKGSATVAFSSDTGGNDNAYTISASASKTTGSLTLPSAIEPWYGP